jgi:hypothetical protein
LIPPKAEPPADHDANASFGDHPGEISGTLVVQFILGVELEESKDYGGVNEFQQ